MKTGLCALGVGVTLAVAVAAHSATPTAPKAAPQAAARPATPGAAAAPKPAGPSDKAQIEALERRFIAAFNAKDVKAIMANYAPGDELFVFDVVPPRQYAGWDAYRKDWEGLFKAFPGPVKVTMTDLSVTVAGTLAYGHSIQSSDVVAADGTKMSLVARVTDVYRKIGGRWRIVQEHVSVPVDLASGKADLTSKP